MPPVETVALPSLVRHTIGGRGGATIRWWHDEGCWLIGSTVLRRSVVGDQADSEFAVAPSRLLEVADAIAAACAHGTSGMTRDDEQHFGGHPGGIMWSYADGDTRQTSLVPVVVLIDHAVDAHEHAYTAYLPVAVAVLVARDLRALTTMPGMQRKRLRRLAWETRCRQRAVDREWARLTRPGRRLVSLHRALTSPRHRRPVEP